MNDISANNFGRLIFSKTTIIQKPRLKLRGRDWISYDATEIPIPIEVSARNRQI